jgi:hypothetical protein
MRTQIIFALCLFGLLISACSTDNPSETASTPPQTTDPVVNSASNPYSEVGTMYTFAPESSGVVMTDGFIFTFNDSGNPNNSIR